MIKKEFEKLEPFLFGPEDHKQFFKNQGKIICVREECIGCKYVSECTFKENKFNSEYIPNVRRSIAIEDESFLILKPLISIHDIPYLTEFQKLASYRNNLHFLFQNRHKDKFYVFKGQYRYYDTEENFLNSKYVEHFKIIKRYEPKAKLFSLDYSAIEPRLATLVVREQKWIDVFAGIDKIVAKQISLKDTQAPLNHYNFIKDSKVYCVLSGELDKADYDIQCSKCKLKDICSTERTYVRKVAGDWHSKNAEAFYGDSFQNESDKNVKKDMRSVAKVGGLALIYGAYERTLARSLNCSLEKATILRSNFFKALPGVVKFMSYQKGHSKQNKYVANIFNRQYNIQALVDNKSEPKFAYKADNIALNHPIQSLGAELLKIGMFKSKEFIYSNKYSSYYSLDLKPKEVLSEDTLAIISSVHDEIIFLVNDFKQDEYLPQVYKEMRLDYLLDAFKAGFYLEMDCEYDNERSWTSSSRYETSKLFLLNELSLESSDAEITGPNAVLIDISDVSEETLNLLISKSTIDGLFTGIKSNEDIFVSNFKISDMSILDTLNIKRSFIYIKK